MNDTRADIHLPDRRTEANLQEERSNEDKGEVVQVTGIVRLVGNSPFTEIVITAQGKEWYIPLEEEDILLDLQHRTVIVEGEETVKELRFANGLVAGERRTLSGIKIIAVE